MNSRHRLAITLGTAVLSMLTTQHVHASQQSRGKEPQASSGKLLQRAIPSSGELLPVVSFNAQEESDNAAMKELLATLVDSGGKVVDVFAGDEQLVRTAARELGIQDKLFITAYLYVPPPHVPRLPGAIQKIDPAAVKAALEAKLAKLGVEKLDLVLVRADSDVPTYVAVLSEMKKAGRVRYIGVHELAPPPYPTAATFARLESIMRNEPIDFVATDYNAGWRHVEERILPLALERKIAFTACFALNRGRLLQRANGKPLPEWAAEFDAQTWPQFFLKYVLSHPAVTAVRTGTTKPAHLLDNLGAGIGRLPNEAMRKRMAEFVDSLPEPPKAPAAAASPGRKVITKEQADEELAKQTAEAVAVPAAILDRYVGEYKHVAVGTMATVRRDGDKLFVNVQGSGRPEIPFVARSETSFVSASYNLEFQVDGQGKVTGASWAQFSDRIPLERM